MGPLSVVLSSEFFSGPPEEIFWSWVKKFRRAEEERGIIFPELCETNTATLVSTTMKYFLTLYSKVTAGAWRNWTGSEQGLIPRNLL